MLRGAFIPAAYNAQALWWPEEPEAGCHLSWLLYAPSFICFDVFNIFKIVAKNIMASFQLMFVRFNVS